MKQLLSIYFLMISVCTMAQEMLVHNSDLYVSSGETIGLYGDMNLAMNGTVTNNGAISLGGQSASFTNNSSTEALKGNGVCLFQSYNSQTIGGQYPTNFYNLNINNSSSQGILLQNTAYVQNNLSLSQGLVSTNDYKLVVNNRNEQAILFNDSYNNSSYVVGTLERATDTNKQYMFPIGAAKSYNPVRFVSNLQTSANVQASFLPEWFTKNEEQINIRYYGYLFNDFVKDGAWRIEPTKPTEGDFELHAATYNFSSFDESANGYSLAVKTNDGWKLAGKRSLVNQEDVAIQGDYIISKQNKLFGLFAVTYAALNNLRIVNIIEAIRGKETRFIIPEIWKYDDNQIEIFSRWGNSLFETHNYTNNFDFNEYPAGTYYYNFSFTRNGKRESVKSFVEVVR